MAEVGVYFSFQKKRKDNVFDYLQNHVMLTRILEFHFTGDFSIKIRMTQISSDLQCMYVCVCVYLL